jgi:hypothetical protein
MRGDVIEMFKITRPIYDQRVTSFIKFNTQRTRGHHLKLQKQYARTDVRKYNFSNRTTDLWNSLPQDIVSAPSVASFERRLDSYWKNLPAKFNIDEELPISTYANYRLRMLNTNLELAREAH